MAYFTERPNGSWEIRESRRTAEGPRSRTLATFRGELTEEIASRAIERASSPLSMRELRAAASRGGVDIAPSEADRAARSLLFELAGGHRPRVPLLRMVHERADTSSDAERATTDTGSFDWIFKSAREKADDLWNLLLLADYLPAVDAARRERFPRLRPAAG